MPPSYSIISPAQYFFKDFCMRNKRHSTYQVKYKRIRDYLMHLNNPLGQGSCGKVFKAINENSQRYVAVKMIDKKMIRSDQYMEQLFMQEIEILRKIHSEHIVSIIEILESDNNFYIVEELCDHTLQDLITNPKPMTELRALEMMTQVAKAFTVLVREGVMHRDLKPANILLKDDQVKVADFGFAKSNVSQKMVMKSFVGTTLYMSPQMLEKEPYSSKSDVWSFGVIFYELLYKHTPWKADSPQGLLRKIKQEALRLHPTLSPIIADFLKRALALDEVNRLSWDEVFYHQIFLGTFDHLKQENMQIQDKLKMTMTALRQDITRKNISILQLLQTMQLKDNLTLTQFTKFINHISPSLMPQEIRRIFDKLDTDCSGTVEIVQIQAELKKHHIEIDIPPLQRFNSLPIQQEKQSGPIGKLVWNVFRQLMQDLKERRISLEEIFDHFANGQPSIDLSGFTNMLSKIGDFDNQEVKAVFGEIDVDKSNSIQYHQIAELFSKVNQVPPSALEQS